MAVFAALLLLPQPGQFHAVYGQYGYGGSSGTTTGTTTGGSVTGVTTPTGEFTDDVTFKSADDSLVLYIPDGTIGLTDDGDPLSRITMTEVYSPPEPPENNDFIGLSYDLGPDGATFDPPITLSFSYNENWIPSGLTLENLTIGYYDMDTKAWVMLGAEDITIDPDTNTITAKISHFTNFSVMVHTAPAELTVSNLTISPAEVGIAEESKISVAVANAGDISGTYEVTLKINGMVASSKSTKVDGHASKTVSFTTVQGKAGTYSVDVNGLSGKFTVKAVTLEPVVIKSTVSSITAPSTAPAPAAPAVPSAPAPTPAATPWLAIILSLVLTGIVGGVIVWYYGFRT